MIEFNFFQSFQMVSNYFEFLSVCRNLLNTFLMISDTGCHTIHHISYPMMYASSISSPRLSDSDDGHAIASSPRLSRNSSWLLTMMLISSSSIAVVVPPHQVPRHVPLLLVVCLHSAIFIVFHMILIMISSMHVRINFIVRVWSMPILR
jgi:hypothetical protein